MSLLAARLRVMSALRKIACFLGALWMLSGTGQVHAEGSWQMGLFEGLSFRQPLSETIASINRNVLRVDILNPGEVINVLACGTNNNSLVRVLMFDPSGTLVYNTTDTGNVDCNDDFTGVFDPAVVDAHQHVTNSTGVYEVHFTNFNGNSLLRFDVTVTDSVNDLIDPRAEGGRLWADNWRFNAGSFAESRSTDADLYVVADGGFTDTFFVWKLDLNNFAGFGYGIQANSLGVDSPNAAGDVVAGLSVPTAGNSNQEEFPIYLNYPARNFPSPTQSFTVSNLAFFDDQLIDSAITSGGDGAFLFTTDLTSNAVYEIIIDVSSASGGGPDGNFDQGDVFLRGTSIPGDNLVPWNGRDNNGNVVPLGAYQAKLSVRIGEFHFTADDVETSGGLGSVGLKMFRVDPNGTESPTTLFWDDFTVLNSTDPDAFNQAGIFDGDHNWGAFNSGGIGNRTFLDTYTFGISVTPNPISVAIVPDNTPLTTLVKQFSPSTINTGDTSTMQFEIVNNGGTTLTGLTVSDAMPFGMTLVSDPSAITVTGAGCSNFSFSADTIAGGDQLNIIDGTMAGGASCIVTSVVTASIPGSLANSTSAVTSNEVPFGVGSNVAVLLVEPENSGTPFACDASLYEVETLNGASRLFSIESGALPFTRSEFSGAQYSPTSEYQYTGLAWHPEQNYLYSIVTQSSNAPGVPVVGSVLRIDADGGVVNLGLPETGPNLMSMPVISDRFVGGTFTRDGNYIVVTDAGSTSNTGQNIPVSERSLILEIDVSVNPPQVLFNRSHGRDPGDIVAHADGNLYSHTAAEGLIQINSHTGGVNVIGGNVSTRLSSLMADSLGQVYAHTESTGQLLRIDVATGNGTVVSPLAGGVTADGASCAFGVGLTKTATAATVESGSSVTYEVSVFNAADTPVTVDLTDDLADGRSFVDGTLVNPSGGVVNNYGGTNLLTINGMTLAPLSTSVITFDVNIPPGFANGISDNQAVVVYSGGLVSSDNPLTVVIGDATPVEVVAAAGIGAAKRAVVSGNEVTYWFTVANTGAADLQAVSLDDDLDAVFGPGNYSVVVPPTLVEDPGSISVNTAYTGSGTGVTLINASGSTLAPGETVVLRVTVSVDSLTDVGAGFAVYENQVTVNAETNNGSQVFDVSVDGDRVDPNADGIADEQSLTIVDLASSVTVSGVVFEDNGLSAVAHDAVQSGGEPSIAGVVLELRDSSSNLIDTATTDSSGRYVISVPPAHAGEVLQLVTLPLSGLQSISEAYALNSGANVSDGLVQFTPDFNSGASVIDFGKVKTPQWLSDNVAENNPGTTVFHPHRYRAFTEGSLQLSYTNVSGQAGSSAFSATLHLDNNCSGTLDSADAVLPAVLNVVAGQVVCVVNRVFIASNASNDETYTTSVTAVTSYTDPLGTGHSVSNTQQVTDLTRAIATGQGVLSLSKRVQNLTASGAVTTSNTASPGDVLRYSINFRNSGTGPVTEVLIADSTPAFSVLELPVQCPVVLPFGISNCQVLLPQPVENSAGYNGPVQWQFDGAFPAGAESNVSFQIRVE